jgi:RNA polymerase sigma-70 factor (ECF subfamily)
MTDEKNLAGRFEAQRKHLRAVAQRILGSAAEAEDAVQEAWLRLSRSDIAEVGNLGGWLTTVVSRICLDMLRAKQARREDGDETIALIATDAPNAEQNRALADNIGAAMLVVLETLTPAERVAFVLHDMFDLPFDDIAPIIGRTSEASRQLASRARRRVQGGSAQTAADRERKQQVVKAFLTASRTGDLTALLAVLDPNVVLHADAAALAMSRASGGAFPLRAEIRGQADIAEMFNGRAQAARLADIDGDVGAIFAPGGKTAVVFRFTVAAGAITAIDIVADPAQIGAMAVGPPG